MFHQLYHAIRNEIFGRSVTSSAGKDQVHEQQVPTYMPDSVPTDEEISISLRCVNAMALEPSDSAKLEASRILCDLADDQCMRSQMDAAGCIEILAGLLFSENAAAKEHTVLALAQLSECRECASTIIKAEVLPSLIELVCDGTYSTAKMRREAARLVANLAETCASDTAASIGRAAVYSWIESTASLSDPRMKTRCLKASGRLQIAVS
jgi:hypothetical protein